MIYTAAQMRKVVSRAMAAVQARQAGHTEYIAGGQTFVLNVGGYCDRFVRQVVQSALGLASWEYAAASAYDTLALMAAHALPVGTAISQLHPGDIIGWTGYPGHIAIFVGDYYDGRKLIAENCSSRRGDPNAPGTKCTRLQDCRSGWRAYRLGEWQ